MKAKILLVEDDKNLGYVLKDFLDMSGYDVMLCEDGEEGLKEYRKAHADILLLDVMLPLIDGFTLAEEIRKTDSYTPIVFITAKSMKADRIKGFKIGADDYITKPFSTEELQLRINAILRRSMKITDDENAAYTFGKFTFYHTEHLLKTPRNEKRLTKKEAETLKMLCEYKNKVLKREVALRKIWGDDDYFMGRSMDVYITKLRKLLKDDPSVSIVNIHNTGFMLQVNDNLPA
jgi:DNA-binding response OmpR family regulator